MVLVCGFLCLCRDVLIIARDAMIPESQPFEGGYSADIEDIIKKYSQISLLKTLLLQVGSPLTNARKY